MLLFTSSPTQSPRAFPEWKYFPRFSEWPHFVGCLPACLLLPHTGLFVVRSFFCASFRWLFPPFMLDFSVFHNFCSITCRFRSSLFFFTIKKIWALHVLLLCHISQSPFIPPHQSIRPASWGGIEDCEDINTTTSIDTDIFTAIQHAQALFCHIQFCFIHFFSFTPPRFLFYEVLW